MNQTIAKAAITGDGMFCRIDHAFRKIELAAAIVGATLMLATMVLISFDALLRYTFNAPLSFAFYLTENYLMVGMMTLPLAWGFRRGGFIRISAFVQLMPETIREMFLRAGLLSGSAYVAVLAWLAGIHFIEVYESGDVQMGVIDWPVSWSWVWVPIGVGLLAVRLVLMAFGPSRDLQGNHDDAEDLT
ncbi:TRAP-type C4-dicarboxylate transport system, small permease component [Azospirillum oryzae]|uniref:TRAP transporter small permease protein n=1 Tax=Azospirillum oryzae TaxID=286727 RepID=A0A1X7HNQ9_9PROT|nr:TRAP transporter small permease [Azospirillum oryzae]SMF90070.1 TRAP-type C4-dicarboxylate transport system, small permease component [Azospirillum oryzae]